MILLSIRVIFVVKCREEETEFTIIMDNHLDTEINLQDTLLARTSQLYQG